MIAIVDYGMGNLRSVQKAFEHCGAKPVITSRARDIEKAGKLVLPGVGAFTQAMHELKKRKLVETLKEKIRGGTPYLGLCLGLQLLFSSSDEGAHVKGLDLISGTVRRFPATGRCKHLKIPHMGWNTLRVRKKNCPLFKGFKETDYFYFVHSYYGVPEDKSWILSTTRYGTEFCSAIWKGNIFATQFHPEKSQTAGLKLIKNFVRL